MAGVLAGVAFLILLALGFALVLGFVLAFDSTGAATLSFLAIPLSEVANDLASFSASAFLLCHFVTTLDSANGCFLLCLHFCS